MPRLLRGSKGAAHPHGLLRLPGGRGSRRADQLPARPRSPQDGRRAPALRPRDELPHLRPQPQLRASGPGKPARHPRHPVPGRQIRRGRRRILAVAAPRFRKMHPVPPLRRGMPGNPESRHPVPEQARIRNDRRPGVQLSPGGGGLRQLRPVRVRLPGGRNRGEGRHPEGLGRPGGSRQVRRRADGSRRSRRHRRRVRPRTRPRRHRQDGRGPAHPRFRPRVRHPVHGRSHHHRGGERTAQARRQGAQRAKRSPCR